MVGRKPTPNKVLKLRGAYRKDRHAVREDISMDAQIPPPSTVMDAEAKAEWDRLTAALDNAGILTLVDRGALTAYCVYWSRWVQAEQMLKEQGCVIEGSHGGQVENPWGRVGRSAFEAMHRCAVELGFTPSARCRVRPAKKAEPVDTKKRFFKGG